MGRRRKEGNAEKKPRNIKLKGKAITTHFERRRKQKGEREEGDR